MNAAQHKIVNLLKTFFFAHWFPLVFVYLMCGQRQLFFFPSVAQRRQKFGHPCQREHCPGSWRLECAGLTERKAVASVSTQTDSDRGHKQFHGSTHSPISTALFLILSHSSNPRFSRLPSLSQQVNLPVSQRDRDQRRKCPQAPTKPGSCLYQQLPLPFLP